MFGLRPLTSGVARCVGTTPSWNLAVASSSDKCYFAKSVKRMSWQKKVRLQEQARTGVKPERRQPVREKVIRENYLIRPPRDDGKKWRILAASMVERLPVIQPDIKDWEMDMEMVHHAIQLRSAQRIPEGFWTLEPGEEEVAPEDSPWPNEEIDPEDDIGGGFHVAPRETEDDATDNRKSLNRALKGRLFLVVKSKKGKFPWFFPMGKKRPDEKMRDAAVRHLKRFCGKNIDVYSVGNAPVGYISYLHEKDESEEYDGTKIFLYKAQWEHGEIELNPKRTKDYFWVTRNELEEYLDKEIAGDIKEIAAP